jgi:hypothetical protein
MIEDGVQELWRRLSGTEKSAEAHKQVALWKKIVGFTWVMFSISLVSPLFIYPMSRLDMKERWIFPFEITEKVGASTAGAAIAVWGLFLKVYYKGEL